MERHPANCLKDVHIPYSFTSKAMPTKKKQTDAELPDFESTINKLEDLIRKMENSDISLEESLQSFELGVKLTREAQQALVTAEQRVRVLVDDNGEVGSEPLNRDENNP